MSSQAQQKIHCWGSVEARPVTGSVATTAPPLLKTASDNDRVRWHCKFAKDVHIGHFAQ